MSNISHQSYMDKVPVKISEKYKPPPTITLPFSINQRLNNLDDVLNSTFLDYDFSLERNVLLKIQEWKKVRDTERENRRERIRKYELNRLRELEEKQKQLLTAVSYPSTDDLSSDEDTTETTTVAAMATATATTSTTESFSLSPDIKSTNETVTGIRETSVAVPFSPSHQNFHAILMPTIVPDAILNSDKSEISKTNYNNKINYSDFENDTSSPFDNIELKTINDLDILAQVLNISSSQKHSNTSTTPVTVTTPNNISSKQTTVTAVEEDVTKSTTLTKTETIPATVELQSNNPSANNDESNRLNRNLNDNDFQYNNVAKTKNDCTLYYFNPLTAAGANDISPSPVPPPPPPSSSQLLTSTNVNNFCYSSSLSDNSKILELQNYNTIATANAATVATNELLARRNVDSYNFYNNLPNNQNNYLYNNYTISYRNYPNHQQQQQQIVNSIIDNSNNQFQNQDGNVYQQTALYTITPNSNTFSGFNNSDKIPATTIASTDINSGISGISSSNRSKSVPDILKELNDEIRDSEMKRNEGIRKYQDLENYQKMQTTQNLNSNNKKYKDERITSDTFMKLSPSSQILAKNISLMGFPLERVSKIAEKFGNDDKKIVEHLIPLSELLDLGFDETKISEALIKFDNNKEKALDFLIS